MIPARTQLRRAAVLASPLAVSVTAVLAALAGLAGCNGSARGGDADSALPDSGRVDAPGQVYVDSMGKANAHLTGGQLVAAATALNDAEIAAARLAARTGRRSRCSTRS